jgi:hypothetical protein
VDATPPWETRVREVPQATTGPFDERDAPSDGLERVDLGALRIPLLEGVELRLDVDESQQVVAATLAGPHGSMQLGVFAAPRSEGIWDDVRGEIAGSLTAERGSASGEQDGAWGTELHGVLPEPGGRGVPVRFVGVDGPRWFLRAMLAGPVATDTALAEPFEQVLRGVVVVRGTEPLPVRDPVPLRLPPGVELPGGENPDA